LRKAKFRVGAGRFPEGVLVSASCCSVLPNPLRNISLQRV